MKQLRSPEIEKFYFKNSRILQQLPVRDKKIFESSCSVIQEKKGGIFFRQDTVSKGFYLLVKGKVMIYQTSKIGTENIVYIYSESEAFGYRPLLCNEKHPVTAQALEDCTVWFIPAQTFLLMLKKSATISNAILQMLSHEFNVWINKISAFAQKSVKERLALALIILNEIYRKDEYDKEPAITLTRQNFAKYIGTSLETLVRTLKYFSDENLVRLKGRVITINDYQRLFKITEY